MQHFLGRRVFSVCELQSSKRLTQWTEENKKYKPVKVSQKKSLLNKSTFKSYRKQSIIKIL